MSDNAEVNVDAADVDIDEYNKQNPDFTPEIVDAEPDPADVVDLDEEADA
jgi:hypothetical protein